MDHDSFRRPIERNNPLPNNRLNVRTGYDSLASGETKRGMTPAMASRLTDHVWTLEEMLGKVATCA